MDDIVRIIQVVVPSLALLVSVYFSLKTARTQQQTASNQKRVLTLQAVEKFSVDANKVLPVLRKLFPNMLGGGPIPAESVYEVIGKDEEHRNSLYSYLNLYESLSRGVILDAYDEAVVKMARKGALLAAFRRFEPYIREERLRDKNPALWEQFELLAVQWGAERSLPDVKTAEPGAAADRRGM